MKNQHQAYEQLLQEARERARLAKEEQQREDSEELRNLNICTKCHAKLVDYGFHQLVKEG